MVIKQTIRAVFVSFLSLACLAGPCSGLAAETPDRVLTTAAAVRSLSAAEAARHYPVKLRGTVTFYDEALYSRFVQDETAGIYLMELTNTPSLVAGQVVEVEGVTGPGEYAPVIIPTSVKVVGSGKLPDAQPVSLEQLVAGSADSQLVEFGGSVRAVHYDKESQYYLIDFVKGGERFSAYAKHLPVAQPQDLVDSTVKVRGVGSSMFNHQRQLFGIRLLVPQADALVVEKPAPSNPYDLPVKPIDSLLQFAQGGDFGGRVKVTGTVVYSEPGSAIFIQNGAAGLNCQTLQRDLVQPGDQVEILGFPAKGEYTPIMVDAIYRKVGTGTEPKAIPVDVNAILTGIHDCQLVQIHARVLDRVQRGLNQFLILQAGDYTFQAFLPQAMDDSQLAGLQNGSEVMATGICMIKRGNNWQAGDKWRAASFDLLLRSPKDVVVLQAPTNWAMPNELFIAVVSSVIALGALLWVAVLKLKLRQRTKN